MTQPIQCDKCGSSAAKVGETRTDIIYRCFYRHLIYVAKPSRRIPVQRGSNPPNNAA